jgi:hydroxymethylpyrimidine/phosphomethylpyrimidine kinase
VSTTLVVAQIDAVASDIGADAVKTGMLANAAIVDAVAGVLGRIALPFLVVDPVMIAKGGDRLLEPAAVEAIRVRLLPLAHVVTPNIPEAEELAGMRIASLDDMRVAARRILELGPRVVLVKGGHLDGDESVDIACAGSEFMEFRGERLDTVHTHGTGCTLASAIAANLALGHDTREAIGRARTYVEGAIRNAPGIGHGHGPLGHFWRMR